MRLDFLRKSASLMREAKRGVYYVLTLPAASYFVFVSRAEKRPIIETWPVQLDMPLPTVPIPLRDTDPDVRLNLQKALQEIYDTLNYDLSLAYSRPPEVPLPERWAIWAKERLHQVGVLN